MSRREQYRLQFGLYEGPVQLKLYNFPWFKDGDVMINITGARHYQLHSSILKNSSPMLTRLLDDQFTAKLTKLAVKKGVVIRNRLIAVKNTEPEHEVQLILKPVSLNDEGKPIEKQPLGLDLENGMVVPPVYTAYDVVFRAFYNKPIDLGEFEKTSLTDILEMAMEVIQVAEYLEVIDMMTKPFEATLLSTGQMLHRSIAKDPAAWLDFAYRIKSKVIFREALIHAAGQFNTPDMQTAMKESMKKPILEVVETRGKKLMHGVKTALRKVLSYYPAHMQRALTLGVSDIDNIGRHSYANDIFSWMALTAFRHYISQHVANDQTHNGPDMGYGLLSAMSKGGDSYLDKDTLAGFQGLFPTSGRGTAVVEGKIEDLKDEMKRFVQGFMKNNSQLHTAHHAHKYFTCSDVDMDLDYPWVVKVQPQGEDADADAESNDE